MKAIEISNQYSTSSLLASHSNSYYKEWNAEAYAQNSSSQVKLAQELLEKIELFSCVKSMKVLDIGCGDGKITQDIAIKYPHLHIIGLDISKSMIEKAKSTTSMANIDFICMDAADPELAVMLSTKFDCIISFSSIHWIKNQTQLFININLLSTSFTKICLMFYTRDNDLWDAIEITAESNKWKALFPNYSTPYFGETEKLRALFAGIGINPVYDKVCQKYSEDGEKQLRDYLSGITPIYVSLQEILESENCDAFEVKRIRNSFIDDVIIHLSTKENDTFIKYENGTSVFNYTRVVFSGHINKVEPESVVSYSYS